MRTGPGYPIPVPCLRDIPMLAGAIALRANDSDKIIVVGFEGAGMVFALPGTTPKETEFEVMVESAGCFRKLNLLSNADVDVDLAFV